MTTIAVSPLRSRLGTTWRLVVTSRAAARLAAARRMPTRLGWMVAAGLMFAGVIGLWLSWSELRVIALFCLVLLAVAVRYTVGKADFSVTAQVEPQWVQRREAASARFDVRSLPGRRLRRGVLLEIPVALGKRPIVRHERQVPAIGQGESANIDIELPTASRGVVVIGPVRTVRGDPVGLLRREMSWSAPVELVVNPDTVPIGNIGAGLLRDLEGQSTNDRSVSDVAFHSLREYAPGDDLRHVHAFTSARFGRPMVRQFVDTRTARLSIVVSGNAADYAGEEEFELALSIGGSVAVRGVEDDQRVAVFAAGRHTPSRSRQSRRIILDAFARADFGGGPDLIEASASMQRLAPDTSIAVLITGSPADLPTLRRAANRFGPDVRCVAVKVDAAGAASVAQARRLFVVSVPTLADFGSIFGRGRR
jgi:uncharacterized protein (DUF58 family)